VERLERVSTRAVEEASFGHPTQSEEGVADDWDDRIEFLSGEDWECS
jgi:hypothetical protein